MCNRSGFSLVEIIVALVVFALVIVGLLGLFVAGGKNIIHARERMTSAELGKLFIDSLQMDVRQDTWDLGQASNALTVGTTYCDSVGGHTQNKDCPTAAQRKVNNRDFSAQYVIDGVSGTDLRLVTTTITWNEPSP
ncbi:MAG: prepilin-type N-terminal cleavage/methylation domain-containing protein [Candidatus Omnitrophica bacterium]|nr:prepilin-type N-terminal cleavage/methylation domain-containing protein [Candidatus Omnitrophota bacterium]